jgi:hypothetical protein
MKGTILILALLINLCLFAKVFAADVYADPKFGGPLLTAGVDKPIILAAEISNPCTKACQAENAACKDKCAAKNATCQKACEHDENCIFSCGKSLDPCINGCDPDYRNCMRDCRVGMP